MTDRRMFISEWLTGTFITHLKNTGFVGKELPTMFVDEGFGTLDPESLDAAINSLMDLRDLGRLVGIISHVEELRERIDARLEVTLGKSGSHAKFIVNN